MLQFECEVKKFNQNGEKTGWTYIEISQENANLLNPEVRTSYRVKGKIGKLEIKQVALLPMGEGDFIVPINSEMRKVLKCQQGDKLVVQFEKDDAEFEISKELMESLEFEPEALSFFSSLSKGHQRYFSNWIDSAKTYETKSKRILQAVVGLSQKMDYGQMIRNFKNKAQNEL